MFNIPLINKIFFMTELPEYLGKYVETRLKLYRSKLFCFKLINSNWFVITILNTVVFDIYKSGNYSFILLRFYPQVRLRVFYCFIKFLKKSICCYLTCLNITLFLALLLLSNKYFIKESSSCY